MGKFLTHSQEKDHMMHIYIYLYKQTLFFLLSQGCKKNEHLAFQYLQKAAEHAVEDLEAFSNTVNTSASKGELIMAIYELGVSFRHGWGVSNIHE